MTPDERHELTGLRRLISGEQVGVSTGICETTTYGYGYLDPNGYWEFPVAEADVLRVRALLAAAEAGEQWKQKLDEALWQGKRDLLDPLHDILSRYGVASRSMRDGLDSLPGDICAWAANACRQSQTAELGRVRAELARLRPLAEAGERMTWQPMETAPKDTSVLVWLPHGYADRATYHTYADPSKHQADGWWSCDSDYAPVEVAPTHWMPLPDPPALLPADGPEAK